MKVMDILNNFVNSEKAIHKANVTDFKGTFTQTMQVTQLAGTNAWQVVCVNFSSSPSQVQTKITI